MKALPVGVQDFKVLRTSPEDYLYIDKTEILYNLMRGGRVFFLSRPRRFGKSLLLSTLKYLFKGEKELFKGLWIEDKWDWDDKYPVALIDFGKMAFQSIDELKLLIEEKLSNVARDSGIKLQGVNYASKFEDLIYQLRQKYNKNVVILIDEYDKPILDNVDNMELAKKAREILRGFYTIIKSMDEHIKFVILTGVSRFSKAGIFSGLNNLKDISLDRRFGDIAGITQEEFESYLGDYVKECGADLDEIQEWYNGYNFLGSPLYNPFDVLNFVDKGCEFDNYWFASGTPSFLIKLIELGNFYIPKMSNLIVGKEVLDRFDIENLRPEVVLFQAGYLTIDEAIETPMGIEYKLRVPNREVRLSLNDYLFEVLSDVDYQKKKELENRLYFALDKGDVKQIEQLIRSVFEAMPYNYHTNNQIARYEGYYASVLYSFFASTGFVVVGEDTSRAGRADIALITKKYIYIIEIKTDANDEEAIKQIEERKYCEKYQGQGKKIYLIGINFDTSARQVSDFRFAVVD